MWEKPGEKRMYYLWIASMIIIMVFAVNGVALIIEHGISQNEKAQRIAIAILIALYGYLYWLFRAIKNLEDK